LARVDKELKQLRAQLAELDERRSDLLADLGECPGSSGFRPRRKARR
jgi:hypothetical protein